MANIPFEIWPAGSLALDIARASGANEVVNAMGTSLDAGALTIAGRSW